MFVFLRRHRDQVTIGERLASLEDAARSEHVRAAMATPEPRVHLPVAPIDQHPAGRRLRAAAADCSSCGGMGRLSVVLDGERCWAPCGCVDVGPVS